MSARQRNERRLTIEHLRSFVMLGEELSFSRAASRLYVAASPFSRRIKEFEDAVGVVMFERTSRQVRLTAAGSKLLPRARDLVRQFDALPWLVRDDPAVAAVRIGVTVGGVDPAERAAVVGAARDALGACTISLEPVHPAQSSDLLTRGELDLLIVTALADAPGCEAVILRAEKYGVALPASDRRTPQGPIRLESLAHLRFARIDLRPATTNMLELYRRVAAAGITDEPVIVDDLVALADVVATQSCFTFVPLDGSPTRRALDDPEIAIRSLGDFDYPRLTIAAWLPERSVDGVLARIVAVLRQRFPPATMGPDVRGTQP